MSKFLELIKLNLNDVVEKKPTGKKDKNGKEIELSYLTWAYAWMELKRAYPEASYTVFKNDKGLPYFSDDCGAVVYTSITAGGETHEMWMVVMDGSNNALKSTPQTIETKFGKKTIAAYDMFDINKAIMRCLAKNVSIFGIGLYLYAGEDLPIDTIALEKTPTDTKAPVKKVIVPKLEDVKALYMSKLSKITDKDHIAKLDAILMQDKVPTDKQLVDIKTYLDGVV